MRSYAWWRRLRVLIYHEGLEADYRLRDVEYRRHCAALSHGNLTPESFESTIEAVNDLQDTLRRRVAPWLPTKEEAQKSKDAAAIEMYANTIGNPDSPEFQSWLAQELAAYDARAAQVKAQSAVEAERDKAHAEAAANMLKPRGSRFRRANGKIV